MVLLRGFSGYGECSPVRHWISLLSNDRQVMYLREDLVLKKLDVAGIAWLLLAQGNPALHLRIVLKLHSRVPGIRIVVPDRLQSGELLNGRNEAD
jgi:hypothetical protein